MTATNAFSFVTTSLCPTVVVGDESDLDTVTCDPPTVYLAAPYANSTVEEPIIITRSMEATVQVKGAVNCPQNVTKMYYSWKVRCCASGCCGGR